MENQQQQQQQPSRPWFRLASQVRMEPPPQTRPPPPVRPTFVPALRTSIVIPSQPQPRPAPPAPAQTPSLVTSEPITERRETSSSVPPSPKQQTLGPVSSVPTTPLPRQLNSLSVPTTPTPRPPISSSLPVSPPRVSEEPVTLTAPILARTVVSPPKIVSSSLPTSPIQRAATRDPSPPESPKIIKASSRTPPASPKMKSSAPPPSPLSLPPSQLKPVPEPESKSLVAEQKNVLVQERIGRMEEPQRKRDDEKPSFGQNVKKESIRHKEKENHKKSDESHHDGGMRVITIAGENKGAYMELDSSIKKHSNIGNPHTLSHNTRKNTSLAKNDGNESGSSSSSSSGSDGKSKRKENMKTKLPMTAFVNSNVQSVNNSILFNTSCTHSDPGVHFVFSRKPIYPQDKADA